MEETGRGRQDGLGGGEDPQRSWGEREGGKAWATEAEAEASEQRERRMCLALGSE